MALLKTILVVEPDPAHRLRLAAALGGEEQQVLAIDTLDAARDALDAFRPDLIVSAAQLADGSGDELSRMVHELHGDQVPVILLVPSAVAASINVGALLGRCARLLRPPRGVPLA